MGSRRKVTISGGPPGHQDSTTSDSAGYLFVSYCRKDYDDVVHLVRALRAREVPYWIDFEVIGLVEPRWASLVKRAISQSSSVLFVLTSNSRRCQNCGYELEIARTSQRPVRMLEPTRGESHRIPRISVSEPSESP